MSNCDDQVAAAVVTERERIAAEAERLADLFGGLDASPLRWFANHVREGR